MDEIWEPIIDFERYEISTFGRVRNERTGKEVHQSLTQGGNAKVGLWDGSYQRTRAVKLLVAQQFVEGATDIFDTPINLDNNPCNNRVDNLVWRPRWFAYKYRQQLNPPVYFLHERGPVRNLMTGEIHKTVADAAKRDGVLCTHIQSSLNQQKEVFPFWHQYVLVR